jgi:hypothetical protein
MRMLFIVWALGVGLVAAWSFAPTATPRQIPEGNRGKAFGPHEDSLVQSRRQLRQAAFSALERPWGSRCAGEERKQFIGGLGHYYYIRQNEMEHYPAYYGKLGADYIATQWATTDDQRIDRLTQDAYAKGYLKPADFDRAEGNAGKTVAIVVKDERILGKACAN